MVNFEIKTTFPVSSQNIYVAWLDSKQHGAMTGGSASCSDMVGGSFSNWDEYISGINLKLVPYSEIIQTWRTSEFKEEDEDSRVEIRLTDTDLGCSFTLVHSNIPEGQSDYEQGWTDHYFEPMKAYFV